MKKIISVILVISVMVTSIIGLVSCQNDSLDVDIKVLMANGIWF